MLTGSYDFPQQDKVVYGKPAAQAIAELAKQWGIGKLLIITSASQSGPAGLLAADLGDLCGGIYSGVSAHSPRSAVVDAAAMARSVGAEMLVSFGGGSATDATKVVQLCLWAGVERVEELDDYALGPHWSPAKTSGFPAGVRMVTVPTTLSAGDFNPLAGVKNEITQAKEAYVHPLMAPRGVVLDPAVTIATPPDLWFSTGLRAVDHAIEQLCAGNRLPFADALGAEGLRQLVQGFDGVLASPEDLGARQQCQFGMWMTISALVASQGKGGPSHAIGHTLGGGHNVPHGYTSCVILPSVLQWTESFCADRQAYVSELMGAPGQPASKVVRDLVRRLGLPTTLREVGIGRDKFRVIAEHTMLDPGVKASPRPISSINDVIEILELAAE
ncbi:hypothetical protein AWL63_04100 [Sphingomonas panacis]|uniref:Uncharacterized protein n=1 Tax=Sphingomonas panacis TaxID=1560345 RepID=A0A1B3Z759_9SPHN|nr:iron-containing alcohol dehydrogenase [Sphingomonas panacis]AOH83274.1 hypothetical protein AWL63_04100 [Sphingomonas panacis]